MLPILLLATAGFTVLTTEFMIVGLLPAIARDLSISVAEAGLLITLFAFTVALTGPFLPAVFSRTDRKKLFERVITAFGVERLGLVGAGIIAVALALTLVLMASEKRRQPAIAAQVKCSA